MSHKKYNPICNDCEFWKSFSLGNAQLKRCKKPGNSGFGGNGCPIINNKCKFKVKRLNFLKRWNLKRKGKYDDYCDNRYKK